MSQPRRRRRRGRRGGQGGQGSASSPKQEAIRESQGPADGARSQSGNRSRRRRGRGRSGGRQESSPKSSEDLVRALPRERPEILTAPADGQILEDIIGELQSTWGVPPYPQEYRITIKVAEERESRSESNDGEGSRSKPAGERSGRPPRADKSPARTDGPRREKAPAAPGLSATSGPQREKAPRKRRRRRRRGGAAGGGANPPGGPEGSNGGESPSPEGPTSDEG